MAGPGGREVGRLSVRVLPDTSNFAQSLQRYLDRIERRAQVSVRVDVDDRQLTVLSQRLARLHDETVHVHVRADDRDLTHLTRQLRTLGDRIDVPSLSVGGASAAAHSLGRLPAILASVTAAATQIPNLAGLASSLASLAPAAATAAPALLGVAAAGGAIAVGFKGVGAALSGSSDDLSELTSEARSFVTSVRGFGSQWQEIQRSVQSTLFRDWGATVERVGKSALPVLKTGLTDAASALNRMGIATANSAKALADNGNLGRALKGANKGFENLASVPGAFLESLTNLSVAAAPAFDRVTQAIARGAEGLSERIAKGLESGGLERAISGAVDGLKSLWEGLKDVGTIFKNVFGPAAQVGSGAAAALGSVANALAEVTSTASAQGAIRGFWQVLHQLGATLGGVVGAALRAVAPLFETLVSTISGPLTTALRQVGPALESVVSALGRALGPVVSSVASAFAAMLPIINRVVTAISGTMVEAINEVAPVLQQIGDTVIGVLRPSLEALPEVVRPLLDNFRELAPIWSAMASQILTELGPSLSNLGNTLGELLPIVGQLATAGTRLLVEVLNLIEPAIGPIISAVTWLGNVLISSLVYSISNFVMPIIRALISLLRGDFKGAWDQVKTYLTNVGQHFVNIWNTIRSVTSSAVSAVLGFFSKMGSQAASYIRTMASNVASAARSGMSRLSSAVSSGVSTAVSYIRKLPGQAKAALGSVGSILYSSGRSLVLGFANGIRSAISSVKNAVKSVVGAARRFFPFSPAKEGPFSGRGWVLYSGQSIGEAFSKGITDYRSLVQDASADLIGAAASTLSTGIVPPDAQPAGLQPGDRIALTVDGQHTLDAVIQRGAGRTLQRQIISPAARGRVR